MLKSYPTRYPVSRAGTSSTGTRVIRLTATQEAVLQEQFNRWPRAPYTADVILLAAETGLSEADVEVSKHVPRVHQQQVCVCVCVHMCLDEMMPASKVVCTTQRSTAFGFCSRYGTLSD